MTTANMKITEIMEKGMARTNINHHLLE